MPSFTQNTTNLSLDGAKVIIEGCEEKARAIGVDMNIAVVDAATHLLAFSRMPKAKITSIDIALVGTDLGRPVPHRVCAPHRTKHSLLRGTRRELMNIKKSQTQEVSPLASIIQTVVVLPFLVVACRFWMLTATRSVASVLVQELRYKTKLCARIPPCSAFSFMQIAGCASGNRCAQRENEDHFEALASMMSHFNHTASQP